VLEGVIKFGKGCGTTNELYQSSVCFYRRFLTNFPTNIQSHYFQSDLEPILSNFFLHKADIFLFFIIKLGHLRVNKIYPYITNRESLTAKKSENKVW